MWVMASMVYYQQLDSNRWVLKPLVNRRLDRTESESFDCFSIIN